MHIAKVYTCLALSLATSIVAASEYIRITAPEANIRFGPSVETEVIGTARAGDVFSLNETEGGWYEIFMFSGEGRYIHRSLADVVATVPELPDQEHIRRNACIDVVRAQNRAGNEARRQYPSDIHRQIDLERLLYDRYELPIFHKYGIAPAKNGTLVVECVRKDWLP